MGITIHCAHCGKARLLPTGHARRSFALGLNLYCGRKCSGLGRRLHKTKAQKVEEKRIYDASYRTKNLRRIKAAKRESYLRNFDREKERIRRKGRMLYHVEYCRQPKYRAYKREYDAKRRSAIYGPYSEAYRLYLELNRDIKERMSNAEISQANETFNKRQQRRREAKEGRSRPRHRYRRDRHKTIVGS